MKITLNFRSPIQIVKDGNVSDTGLAKTIDQVIRENNPSKFAVAAARTKMKLAASLSETAARLAEEADSVK